MLNNAREDRSPAHPHQRRDTPSRPPAGAGSGLPPQRLILRTIRRGGTWTYLLVIASLTLAGAETVFPAVLGAVLGGHDPKPWLLGCGLLVEILIGSGALGDLASGVGTARATAWLRRSVLDHLLALGMHSARQFQVGDISTRMVGKCRGRWASQHRADSGGRGVSAFARWHRRACRH